MIRLIYFLICATHNLAKGFKFIESPPEELIIAENIDIILNCTTDRPAIKITWYYQQVHTGPQYEIDSGNTLTIPDVGLSYEGLYFCQAEDSLGEMIESEKSRLRVAYIKDQFLRTPSQVYTLEGSTVEFACTPPQSYPSATITWEMDQVLYTNSRSYITDNYTLVIVGILPEDKGNYQCVATNPVSGIRKTSLEGELYVTQIPDKGDDGVDYSVAPVKSIESYREVIEEGLNASFLCGFQGVPYPVYSWFHPNGSIVEENEIFSFQYKQQVLQISSVTRNMSGLYTCSGNNIAGTSYINVTLFVNYSQPLRFVNDTPPAAQITDVVGNERSVQCLAEGTPPVSVRWMKGDELLTLGPEYKLNTTSPLNITIECVASNPYENISTLVHILIIGNENDTEATNSTTEKEEEDEDNGSIPSLKEVSADVICTSTEMILSIRSFKRNFTNLHLLDKDCKVVQNDTHYYLVAPLNGCGSLNYFNSTHIIYKNQVIEPKETDSRDQLISRSSELHVTFECAYPRDGSTKPVEWNARGMVNVVVKGVGSFTFSLAVYTNSSFTEMVETTQYPFQVIVQDKLYLQVSLVSSDESLSLHISDAVASNSPVIVNGSEEYSIIKDGCTVDPTLEYLPSPNIKTKRLTIKAFKFLAGLPIVYLHAFLRVCNISEDHNSCNSSCRINKRSVGSMSTETYHVYQGPFISGIPYSDRLSTGQPIILNFWLSLIVIAFYYC